MAGRREPHGSGYLPVLGSLEVSRLAVGHRAAVRSGLYPLVVTPSLDNGAGEFYPHAPISGRTLVFGGVVWEGRSASS